MLDPFSLAAGWLQEHLILPALYAVGGMEWEEISFGWALFACYGAAQVLITFAVCLPLEYWRPVERWPDKKAVWVDVFYTVISRVGILPLLTFVLFYQIQVWLTGWMTDNGWVPPTLERLFPFLLGQHLATFCLYAIILDFADYWRHRLSHRFGWWYGLHSLHHAQRQMTFWSDDRNHLLDDVESLSHANARISFGRVGERLLISPRFHRAHHGVLAAGQKSCNYGAVLPWWDMLFGTADFGRAYVRTGDPGAPEAMATGSYLAQQTAGFQRMLRLSGLRKRRASAR